MPTDHRDQPVAEDAPTVSTLEIFEVASNARRPVYETDDLIEAPNWTRDGKHLVFNANGRLYAMPWQGGTPVAIDTGPLVRLNNDHGFSPDGRWLAVSDQSRPDGLSRVYLLPFDPVTLKAGAPRLMTEEGPSYWHAWSPDGTTIVNVALRDGDFDLFAQPADGTGREVNLTRSPGLDDGPEYAPDGRYIYFNSVRSGNMKLWRIKPDGSDPEQMTFDPEWRDWFPHLSPDGRSIVFVSFNTADVAIDRHPRNKNVVLWMMPSAGGEPKVIARLFGGQGTINVPSWSPDGRHFAFVSYRLKAK